jgi:diguanylate cyclase (GGDEF)-like protein
VFSVRKPVNRSRRGFKPLSLRQGVLAFMVVVCLLAIGLTGQETWNNRAADVHASSQQTTNLAQSLSQQATDSFQTVDGVLGELVDRAETDGSQPRALRRLQKVMSEHVKQLRVLHNLFIVDAGGNGLVNALPQLKNANYRDRPYFIFHRTHAGQTTHIGRTVRSRTDGSWIITVTRRLNRADGSFAGLAMATISGDYFLHLYNQVDIERSGIITLALADGTILVRKPFEQANIGKSIAKAPFFRSALPQTAAGSYENRSVVDGISRFYAYHRVSRYPLLIVVGVAEDEVLAAWRWETLLSLVELVGMISIVAILGGYLVRQIKKRETAEALLERLVLVDGLTGLGNRHQFEAVLGREWRRAVRAGTSLAFLMIDADEFKGYNDRYGHQAGDNVLKSIAGCISGALGRPADLAARYGGEEFAVFLPDTSSPGAFAVGEAIRRAVVALNIAHVGSPHGIVTVSIGVGRVSPNPNGSTSPSALVKAADSALYQAKSKGRNQTEPAATFIPTLAGVISEYVSEPV